MAIIKNHNNVSINMVNRVRDEAAKQDLFVNILLKAHELTQKHVNLLKDPQVIKAFSQFFNSTHVSQDMKVLAYYELQGIRALEDAYALLMLQNLSDESIEEFLNKVQDLLKGYKIRFPDVMINTQDFKKYLVFSFIVHL